MSEYLKTFLFMEDIIKGEDTHQYVFQIMRYQFIPANTTIFNYNDTGDLFYIILRGSVKICVPKPTIMELNQTEYQELLASS